LEYTGQLLAKLRDLLAPAGVFGDYLRGRGIAPSTASYRIRVYDGRQQPRVANVNTPRLPTPEPTPPLAPEPEPEPESEPELGDAPTAGALTPTPRGGVDAWPDEQYRKDSGNSPRNGLRRCPTCICSYHPGWPRPSGSPCRPLGRAVADTVGHARVAPHPTRGARDYGAARDAISLIPQMPPAAWAQAQAEAEAELAAIAANVAKRLVVDADPTTREGKPPTDGAAQWTRAVTLAGDFMEPVRDSVLLTEACATLDTQALRDMETAVNRLRMEAEGALYAVERELLQRRSLLPQWPSYEEEGARGVGGGTAGTVTPPPVADAPVACFWQVRGASSVSGDGDA
jgi:hypothetical protein